MLKSQTPSAAKVSKAVRGTKSRDYFKKRKSSTNLSRIEVAERLGCSTMTVLRMEKTGELVPYRFGRNFVRYAIEDIEKLEREARGAN